MSGRSNRWAAAVALAALAAAETALAAPIFTPAVDLTAGLGYSTNPFLVEGGDTGSFFAEVGVFPRLDIIEQDGSGRIAAYYRRQQYFDRYSDNQDYGASGATSLRVNPLLSLRGSLAYDSSIIGNDNILSAPIGGVPTIPGTPTEPGAPAIGNPVVLGPILVDPIGGDVGLVGLRQRRNALTGSFGATLTPNARDIWQADFTASRQTYPNGNLGLDFTSYGGTLGYSRAISETTTVGVRVGVTQVNYQDQRISPNTLITSPQLTFTRRLASGWTLSGGAGVSITERKLPGKNDRQTNFAGNLSACRERERGSLCASVARDATATGFGGVQQTTSATLGYSYKLDAVTTARANAAYSRVSSGAVASLEGELIDVGDADFVSAGAAVDRRISERLSLTGSVAYRDSFADNFTPRANFTAQVGVAYALGGRR